MITVSASSSRPGAVLHSADPACKLDQGYQPVRASWAKRVFIASARALKGNPLLFSAIVKSFRALQRAGINVTPNHFYWPVPDLTELEAREWCNYAAPPRCEFRLREQAELARHFAQCYLAEYNFNSASGQDAYHYGNGYFESCDAEVAYCMVRHWKPRRIIEIGSGYSTRILAAALRANLWWDGIAGELITVDPNPERLPQNGLGERVSVVAEPVQRIDTRLFKTLMPDDILFLDSSHVVAIGSDVTREYLQILPALNPGVLVHVHDIFLPHDYPRDAVLNNLWFWSEQYLLQAFLSFNSEFEVLWSASALQTCEPKVLEESFPNWKHSYRDIPPSSRQFVPTADQDRVWPSSFWMRRVQR